MSILDTCSIIVPDFSRVTGRNYQDTHHNYWHHTTTGINC